MKDEIKEILEFDFQSQGERIEINEYERDILKDYITNLEQKYERMKENAKILSKGCDELQSKIDKAIGILEPLIELNGTMTTSGMNKLLNILKGGDE